MSSISVDDYEAKDRSPNRDAIRQAYVPLPHHLQADRVLSRGQVLFLSVSASLLVIALAGQLLLGYGLTLLDASRIFVDVITVLNTVIIVYKFTLLIRGMRYKAEPVDQAKLHLPPQDGWPTITILVPMYREPAKLIRQLVRHIGALKYPSESMNVLLAIESDDDLTRAALRSIDLPDYMKVVVCPPRDPGGKPGACLHALLTNGDPSGLTVIFDVEDIPDVWQLMKAAHGFALEPPSVVCLQAQLQYFNPGTNRLTKLFASEYAMHFALMLRGLDRARAPIPLGGTSNYFRTEALLALGGWDMYNVTEDATLGITIARRGWRVKMLDSVTLEEANSKVWNWVKQRSRWWKGYVQSWLVHMRNPWRLWRELGTSKFMSFQLVVGFTSITAIVNPALWVLTGLYFLSRVAHWTSITSGIESLFPPAVFYVGLLSMVLGNLLVVYFHLAGCMERKLNNAVATTFLLPLYWVLMFVAACKAMFELIHPKQRFTWAHTQHGLVDAPSSFQAHMERNHTPTNHPTTVSAG